MSVVDQKSDIRLVGGSEEGCLCQWRIRRATFVSVADQKSDGCRSEERHLCWWWIRRVTVVSAVDQKSDGCVSGGSEE